MKRRQISGAAFCLALVLACCFPAFGAGGRWLWSEDGWRYERADRSMARSTWEDIDGEWYFFGRDGRMLSGWNRIGNMMYCLEPDGKLARGWRCFRENGGEDWYYYDANGNAVIRWFQDDGKWYWFEPDGVMNRAAEKVIGGRRYYFHEDGSLKVNEYDGFSYIDPSGQKDSRYDVTAVENGGGAAAVAAEARAEIAAALNAFPEGWRKKFVDDDWRFVYEPAGTAHREARTGAGALAWTEIVAGRRRGGSGTGGAAAPADGSAGGQGASAGGREAAAGNAGTAGYEPGYVLAPEERILYFSDVDGLRAGFGEYMYRAAGKLPRNIQFPEEVQVRFYAISELTGLPDTYDRDYPAVIGAVFARYQDEDTRREMKETMKNVCWYVEEISGSRKPDGTLIDRLLRQES